jgi:hypothetical protein
VKKTIRTARTVYYVALHGPLGTHPRRTHTDTHTKKKLNKQFDGVLFFPFFFSFSPLKAAATPIKIEAVCGNKYNPSLSLYTTPTRRERESRGPGHFLSFAKLPNKKNKKKKKRFIKELRRRRK